MPEISPAPKLTDELRSLLRDAEALLRAASAMNGGEMDEHTEATLRELRGRLTALESQLTARLRDVDTYVRNNPWQAVAVAGGAALLLGLIMGRR